MFEATKFFIDGQWVDPLGGSVIDVIDPADGGVSGHVALGTAADVDTAVEAADRAFASFSQSSRQERIDILSAVIESYRRRSNDLEAAVTAEMGAPGWLARDAHVPMGLAHLEIAREILEDYAFEEANGPTILRREPIGVCGLITPWNWPLNQISCKVAPALATGCTVVLKPSEVAPFTGHIYAEIIAEAGIPEGIFNLIHGDGPGVGAALSGHPDIQMISFTGSTRAGAEVARNAAETIKRVHQELGGKSPNIILPSADIEAAVKGGVEAMMLNSGQSCNAPSRMLVEHHRMEQAKRHARDAAEAQSVGRPDTNAKLGPVVSDVQWQRVQELIQAGVEEGATLVAGGLGAPEGLEDGYYVRPTVFADATADMRITREEIFGPVLVMMGYSDIDEAIAIANDTEYGLAAFVQGAEEEALAVAKHLRAGQVYLNYPELDLTAPFGGYKRSGNGREWGAHAFADFLEVKAVMRHANAGRSDD